jgi:hypothetical protein
MMKAIGCLKIIGCFKIKHTSFNFFVLFSYNHLKCYCFFLSQVDQHTHGGGEAGQARTLEEEEGLLFNFIVQLKPCFKRFVIHNETTQTFITY